MTQPTPSRETIEFHKLVEEGTLDDLRIALQNGADPNCQMEDHETPLMQAISIKDLSKIKLLIEYGADPELTDNFNNTALHRAVIYGFAEGVAYLLSLGVDRGYSPKYPLKKIPDISLPDSAYDHLDAETKQLITKEEWIKSNESQKELLREFFDNPVPEPVIRSVESIEVLKLLLEAGDSIGLAPKEAQREYVGLKNEGELQVSHDEYLQHRSPRFGKQNPERMNNPFWEEMIRIGCNTYPAREKFDDGAFSGNGPVWCYDRFGSTITPLPDGRFVQIAGEHEDYYDPDFYIYNDVVIHDGNGGVEIFGYPKEVFPPTDFHTATLCGDVIYIIGCLGYADDRRQGFTPVFKLKLNSWEIETVETSGDLPGWIYDHRAKYLPEQHAILITGGKDPFTSQEDARGWINNTDQCTLDLKTLRWQRVKQ